MKEEHTFLEYEKQVYKYQELVSELQYEVEKVCIHINNRLRFTIISKLFTHVVCTTV